MIINNMDLPWILILVNPFPPPLPMKSASDDDHTGLFDNSNLFGYSALRSAHMHDVRPKISHRTTETPSRFADTHCFDLLKRQRKRETVSGRDSRTLMLHRMSGKRGPLDENALVVCETITTIGWLKSSDDGNDATVEEEVEKNENFLPRTIRYEYVTWCGPG